MSKIAIIPARGGSKRIPRKNITPFRGRPMISWTIEAALESGIFDRILVSTDDEEIADCARLEGAEVPFLRNTHADDNSPVSEAIITALCQAGEHYGETFDTVVQLMPNCPLRGATEIREAWEQYRQGSHSFQISAFEFGWMNPWWAGRLNADFQPDWLFPEERMRRSQDLDRLYCPTGAIWIADAAALLEARTFYGPGHVLCPMHWQAAVDIDDYNDFDMAEVLAELSVRGPRAAR
ncbi:cytidylyltransferase domain-containing protein [Pseudogemmobacter faecipullorum]|uniref:acylneuraminate cytidylyltransferase family protein n=1 Tax=Pseudogemmobacter faecipullorum TaxID=2755041 RepID=UPI001D034813